MVIYVKRGGWDGIGVYDEMGQWLAVFKGSRKILLRSKACRYLEEKDRRSKSLGVVNRHEMSLARVTLNEEGAERKVHVGPGGPW